MNSKIKSSFLYFTNMNIQMKEDYTLIKLLINKIMANQDIFNF